MNRATNFVYIIHAVGTSRVKIGLSDDPERRLNDLQTGSPFPLELIGSREGTVKIERAIHGYFKDRRVTGEWFEVEPDDALSALLDDNLLAELIRPKPKPKKTGKYPRLNTMHDLYSLELSQVLLQAMDAGMIEPEASGHSENC